MVCTLLSALANGCVQWYRRRDNADTGLVQAKSEGRNRFAMGFVHGCVWLVVSVIEVVCGATGCVVSIAVASGVLCV